MLVADCEDRLFESPALDFGEEGRELFFCRQRKLPDWFFARGVAAGWMLTNRSHEVQPIDLWLTDAMSLTSC